MTVVGLGPADGLAVTADLVVPGLLDPGLLDLLGFSS
jgi:hypothetical protein